MAKAKKKKASTKNKKKSAAKKNAARKNTVKKSNANQVKKPNVNIAKKVDLKEENVVDKKEEVIQSENNNETLQNKENTTKKEKNAKEKNEKLEKNKNKKNIIKLKKKDSKEDSKEEKEVILEEKKNEKNELITEELKEILKTNEESENVQKNSIGKNKIKVLIIILVITLLFLVVISTIFAIINRENQNIINNISVKNIDISSLSKEEAINRLTDATNKELISEISLKYTDDYIVTLKPEQIEFQYKLDDSIEEAFFVGRKGNILLDNYTIINTTLFGKKIKLDYIYNGELLNQFVEDINSKIPGVVISPTYYIEDNQLLVNPGTDGIQIKKEELKNQIIQAILERNVNKMADGFVQEINIPTENVKAPKIDMEKIYSEIHCEPQNAYYETDPYKIYPDVKGIDLILSVEEAQSIIDQEEKEEYSFELKITEADIIIDEIGIEAFPYLISQFSTRYDASNRNRSTNLELAAQKINGKVIMPGEEFSFNKIVGKRTVEAGYKDAAIYADGGVVDGLAGGICQISSTLYNSVLLANLQITERRNHSFTTSYAPAGRDATVVWGTSDFRFINSRSYPIKIEATVERGIAEFKIHGMQEETEYEVRILPVRTQSIPYATTYEEDPTIIPGQQVIKQAGHSGCKVTTYKELIVNGEIVSKEPISNDTYLPMRTIIKVAPGQKPLQ